MTAVLQGANAYLIAGYLLTWVVLIGYGLSLYFRYKKGSS